MTLCSVDRQPADQREVLCHTVDAGSPRPKLQQSSSLGRKQKNPTPVVSALIMQYRLIEMVLLIQSPCMYQLVTLTSWLRFWSPWCYFMHIAVARKKQNINRAQHYPVEWLFSLFVFF